MHQVLVAAGGLLQLRLAHSLVETRGLLRCGVRTLVAACMWDLFPWPVIEPRPPALGAWSLNHCTTREVPNDHFCFFFLIYFYLFIYFWLCWVFVSVRGLSLVAASEGHSSSRRAGLSLSRPLLLRSTGSRRAGSVVVSHGPICSAACGIFPNQGSNPCPLHWQADSQPLRHRGSPQMISFALCKISLRLGCEEFIKLLSIWGVFFINAIKAVIYIYWHRK